MSDERRRLWGRVCLWAGIIGAVQGVVLAAVPAQVASDRFSYPFDVTGHVVAQVSFFVQHLGLVAGLVALCSLPVAKGARPTRGGLWAGTAGMVLLAVQELVAIAPARELTTSDLAALVGGLYTIPLVLIGIGLLCRNRLARARPRVRAPVRLRALVPRHPGPGVDLPRVPHLRRRPLRRGRDADDGPPPRRLPHHLHPRGRRRSPPVATTPLRLRDQPPAPPVRSGLLDRLRTSFRPPARRPPHRPRRRGRLDRLACPHPCHLSTAPRRTSPSSVLRWVDRQVLVERQEPGASKTVRVRRGAGRSSRTRNRTMVPTRARPGPPSRSGAEPWRRRCRPGVADVYHHRGEREPCRGAGRHQP